MKTSTLSLPKNVNAKKAIKISTFMPSFNMFFDMKEVNYHTMYVGKIEKVLVRDDEYLG
jgi:hypothetical protein